MKAYEYIKGLSPMKKTVLFLLLSIVAGLLYYVFIKVTGFAFPCMMYELTGLKCPTCGITHMFLHMAQLDFKAAFEDNQFVFLTWPLSGLEILYVFYKSVKGEKIPKWNYIFIYILVGIAIIFCIIRNVDIIYNS
ncbi:MAG: DUF2752 domain-containing protein [Clostridiales bacterium]|nr:DUF2752 domain-containing protein [Clostridiales bacterium]